ncbi:MAG: FkbM family methyltransferase [Sphingomonadales bacterium]|nr:MAG: FkbM family methyltransferase [Sphingomonadales bacterium]
MRSQIKRLLGIPEPVAPEIAAYERLKAKGFVPDRIIDVGAYEGSWTRLVRSVFDHVPVTMIEAQEGKKPVLDAVCREIENASLVSALLGRTPGTAVTFYEMETGSSTRPENSNVAREERIMTTRTLDDVIDDSGTALFLKIDVQGSELDVLSAGQRTLARCEVVQLETALLPYNIGAPQITEVFVQMGEWGFSPFDFAGFIRPNGVDLVQTDVLFVRTGSALRAKQFHF